MQKHQPILIGDLLRQIGIIRTPPSTSPVEEENSVVDSDLVCALFYYDYLVSGKDSKHVRP